MELIVIAIGLFVVLPLLLLAIVLIPPYLGIWSALYWLYDPGGSGRNPMGGTLFYYKVITQQYQTVFLHWWEHKDQVDFLSHTLPLLLPPLIGISIALYLLYKLIQYIRGIFRVD